MPELTDVDPEFAKLERQLQDLNSQKCLADRELASLREELAEARGPSIPSSVAALLGDEPDSATGKRQRAAELSKLVGDLMVAIDIISKRLRERRDIRQPCCCRAPPHWRPRWCRFASWNNCA
ncbi:hypothetical protein [Mesorhizobium sp. M0435]|uniref:hypothetical protein n=1 Tax=Mesorhizobium sp. M0435 TaxID=2956944 RepID=UPI00333847D0